SFALCLLLSFLGCSWCSLVALLKSLGKSRNTGNTVVFSVFSGFSNASNIGTPEHVEHDFLVLTAASNRLRRSLLIGRPLFSPSGRRRAVSCRRCFPACWSSLRSHAASSRAPPGLGRLCWGRSRCKRRPSTSRAGSTTGARRLEREPSQVGHARPACRRPPRLLSRSGSRRVALGDCGFEREHYGPRRDHCHRPSAML